jgi:hypothetical protein
MQAITFRPKLIYESAYIYVNNRSFYRSQKEIWLHYYQPTTLAVNVTELGGMLPDLILVI